MNKETFNSIIVSIKKSKLSWCIMTSIKYNLGLNGTEYGNFKQVSVNYNRNTDATTIYESRIADITDSYVAIAVPIKGVLAKPICQDADTLQRVYPRGTSFKVKHHRVMYIPYESIIAIQGVLPDARIQ